ncbi:unnamed protein product [Owenia fusiformis]|uniref:Uncharacterized protein n=1 Tax=Owenia fusiformis TaxID=6347 RepID=A0A8J1UHD3_OWEFU|nr:unnamed protein product [Owenia fusiformis]
MATGGDGGAEDHPLAGRGNRRQPLHRHLSRDDIGNQARYLLNDFIHHRMQRDGIEDIPDDLIAPGTPRGPHIDRMKEVADTLREIGDQLDGDERLQQLIAAVPPECPEETFMKVAKEIFKDGVFNWGRVVALFYFTFKMAVKAVRNSLNRIPLIRTIMEWVVHFIRDHVAAWIIERGGWEAISEYFGTPMGQFLGIFASAALVTAYILYKHSR